MQNNWIVDPPVCSVNLEESLLILWAELGAGHLLFSEGGTRLLKKGWEELEKGKTQARRARASMAAMNPDLCGLHERLAWPLLRKLAGSPGLHLQTNLLCFLPAWDFLVARALERFTKAGKRVPEGAVSHFQDFPGCCRDVGMKCSKIRAAFHS